MCGDPDTLCAFGPEPDEHGTVWIKNAVFKEVFIDDTKPVDRFHTDQQTGQFD